jgi:UDP-3-O-[3-hydroxymyristoyl] glucosamine N-acyltransferase
MVDNRFYDIKGPFNLGYIIDYLSQFITFTHQSDMAYNLAHDIYGIADLQKATTSHISVFSNIVYKQQFLQTKAAVCLTYQDQLLGPRDTFLLKSSDPYYAYCKLISLFYAPKISSLSLLNQNGRYLSPSASIGKNTSLGYNVVIEDDVEIGDNCLIDSGCVIKSGVKIGNNARIGANVYISYSIIGNDVVILPGACLGQDGYGFATHQGVHHKIFHIGRVLIENDVEIGANTTIDRGSISDTTIGSGCKIDNLVQIGHNASLGQGCLIVAQVGIAGSSKIGNYCALGGQSGVSGHLSVADKVRVASQSGVLQSVAQSDSMVGGTPAVPIKQWHKQSILLKKLTNKKALDHESCN